MRPAGPPTGKSFRFVSCVRARGGGEVGFEWFWDSTGQLLDQQSRGFKEMKPNRVNSPRVLKAAIDLEPTVQGF